MKCFRLELTILLLCCLVFIGVSSNQRKLAQKEHKSSKTSKVGNKKNENVGPTVISRFNPGGQYISLTFSGGPHSILTPKILDILANHKVNATFFVVGRQALYHPQIIQRIIRDGHDLGHQGFLPYKYPFPHTSTDHFPLSNTKPILHKQRFMKGITNTIEVLYNITGHYIPYFRPPMAAVVQWTEVLQWLGNYTHPHLTLYNEDLKKKTLITNTSPYPNIPSDALKIVLSSLNSQDLQYSDTASTREKSYEMVDHVIKNIKPGDILLCHDHSRIWLDVLPLLLKRLEEEGHYELLTLSQMFSFPDDTPH